MTTSNASTTDLLRQTLAALREERQRNDALAAQLREPIAVVGMACRLPGAAGPEQLWRNLLAGEIAAAAPPAGRAWVDPRAAIGPGGYLDEVAGFDAQLFGLSPQEAAAMDPQHRLLLELAWEAIEAAGIAPGSLRDSLTGVYVGAMNHDYAHWAVADAQTVDSFTAAGNGLGVAAGRLAFTLGLGGPAVALDTNCSSSLVAAHLACQGLRARECDLALVGGVNLILTGVMSQVMQAAGALAADGRCKTFDSAADGYGRAEGCGMVVLRRLSDAVAAGDRVLAVIRGSAVNHNGASSALPVPNGPAQRRVIEAALRQARVDPLAVDFVETHGTGTSLGDPIELEALARAYGLEGGRRQQPLMLGALKANLGHLEGASGIAGLIKAVLVVSHGHFPPHRHVHHPNPLVPWDRYALQVPAVPTPWRRAPAERLAGVSSFGFGGTNVHLIVGGFEGEPAAPPELDRPLHVLGLSARSATALQELAGRYVQHLAETTADPGDICGSALAGRDALPYRLAVVGQTNRALQAELERWLESGQASQVPEGRGRRVVFLFSGQGSQYGGMGRELYETQPVFRREIDQCAALLAGQLEVPLTEVLWGAAQDRLQQTGFTQPALFAFEYALARLWQSWGVEPATVLGHSVGEYVAACVAGVFSLADGLKLIAARGRLMQALPAGGGMLAVWAEASALAPYLREAAGEVAVAAVNGPRQTVVAGPLEALRQIAGALQQAGIASQPLAVSHAFHSPLMAPMEAPFAAVAAEVGYAPPQLPLISNVSGAVAGAEVARADYWIGHVRAPVRFADGMRALPAAAVYLEIGPGTTLLALGKECLAGGTAADWLPSWRRQDGWGQLLGSVAALYRRGVHIDWQAFDRPWRRRKVPLPTYPFQHKIYWKTPPAPAAGQAIAVSGHPLLLRAGGLDQGSPARQFTIDTDALAALFVEHRVFGLPVLPAAAMIDLAFAAAGDLPGLELRDLRIHQALATTPTVPLAVGCQVEALPEGGWRWQLYSQAVPGAGSGRTLHAEARLAMAAGTAPAAEMPAAAGEAVAVAALYEACAAAGLDYGPHYRTVRHILRHPDGLTVRVALDTAQAAARWSVDPALLDGAFHALGAVLLSGPESERQVFLPISARSVRLASPLPAALQVTIRLKTRRRAAVPSAHHPPDRLLEVDLLFRSDDGGVVGQVDGLRVMRITRDALERRLAEQARPAHCYISRWLALPAGPAGAPALDGIWTVLADAAGAGDAVAAAIRSAGGQVLVARVAAGFRVLSNNDVELDPADAGQLDALLAHWGDRAAGRWRGLLNFWAIAAADRSSADQPNPAAAARLLPILRHWAAAPAPAAPMWLFTRGASGAGGDGVPPRVEQALATGAAFSGMLEQPGAFAAVIDLDPAADLDLQAAAVVRQLGGPSAEAELAWRAGGWLQRRLVPWSADPSPAPAALAADATYLVTGAFGALGTLMTRWLAARGARHLLLVGSPRERATDGVLLEELAQAGITVSVLRADLADAAAVPRLRAMLAGRPPVRGVLHLAGVGASRPLAQLEANELEQALGAKAVGAWSLLQALEGEDALRRLDFLVLFSSIASVWGSAGGAAYAAANAWLDQLGRSLAAQGVPALVLNWGPWEALGLAAGPQFAETAARSGLRPLRAAVALAWCDALIGKATGQIVIAEVDWPRFVPLYSARSRLRLFERLHDLAMAPPPTAADTAGMARRPATAWAMLPEAEQALAMRHLIATALTPYLTEGQPQVDGAAAFIDLGVNSLAAIEIKRALEAELGLVLLPSLLYEFPTVDALAGELLRRLLPGTVGTGIAEAGDMAAAPPAPASVTRLEPGDCLGPTGFFDFGSAALRPWLEPLRDGGGSPRELAQRIYHRVRDGIRYDANAFRTDEQSLVASRIATTTRNYCVPKAILFVSLARALGLPARLGLAEVRNHLATDSLLPLLGTDRFVHGYAEVCLDGRWLKVSPTFDRALCGQIGVPPLDFDGEHDALDQAATDDGRRCMEYCEIYGVFDDVPVRLFFDLNRRLYPHLLPV